VSLFFILSVFPFIHSFTRSCSFVWHRIKYDFFSSSFTCNMKHFIHRFDIKMSGKTYIYRKMLWNEKNRGKLKWLCCECVRLVRRLQRDNNWKNITMWKSFPRAVAEKRKIVKHHFAHNFLPITRLPRVVSHDVNFLVKQTIRVCCE
jgi:hypothetical protein